MDELLLQPTIYAPFEAPLFLFLLIGLWFLLIVVLRRVSPRWSTRAVWSGAALLLLCSFEAVVSAVVPEMGELREQTSVIREHGSADPLREYDPVFALVNHYRQADTPLPLVVVDDEEGQMLAWARYYVHPRKAVPVDPHHLSEQFERYPRLAHYILAHGNVALPVPPGMQVDVADRHEEWILFHVRER